jgi:hypothetical protein
MRFEVPVFYTIQVSDLKQEIFFSFLLFYLDIRYFVLYTNIQFIFPFAKTQIVHRGTPPPKHPLMEMVKS